MVKIFRKKNFRSFRNWWKDLSAYLRNSASSKRAIHVISAWASENELVLQNWLLKEGFRYFLSYRQERMMSWEFYEGTKKRWDIENKVQGVRCCFRWRSRPKDAATALRIWMWPACLWF